MNKLDTEKSGLYNYELGYTKNYFPIINNKIAKNKGLSITHSLTGEVLYSNHAKMSYNINTSDLKTISTLIK